MKDMQYNMNSGPSAPGNIEFAFILGRYLYIKHKEQAISFRVPLDHRVTLGRMADLLRYYISGKGMLHDQDSEV